MDVALAGSTDEVIDDPALKKILELMRVSSRTVVRPSASGTHPPFRPAFQSSPTDKRSDADLEQSIIGKPEGGGAAGAFVGLHPSRPRTRAGSFAFNDDKPGVGCRRPQVDPLSPRQRIDFGMGLAAQPCGVLADTV